MIAILKSQLRLTFVTWSPNVRSRSPDVQKCSEAEHYRCVDFGVAQLLQRQD